MKDLNKKIINIQYNYLNLPDRIEFEDGSSISYLYDAAGTKLRVVHSIAGNTTTTDYCGDVIYENGTPLPLPFYYPLTNTQSYRLPSDQQIMRHTSGKFAELGQIINNAPKKCLIPLGLFYIIRQRMRLVLNMSIKEKETGGIKKNWTGIRRMWRKVLILTYRG